MVLLAKWFAVFTLGGLKESRFAEKSARLGVPEVIKITQNRGFLY